MFRSTASFTALAMLLWVLPLGNFIKPSQESTACGGGRAFHMCCMMGKIRPASDSGKISFTNASSLEKTAKSLASGGDDLLPLDIDRARTSQGLTFYSPVSFFYPQSYLKVLNPPPKLSF